MRENEQGGHRVVSHGPQGAGWKFKEGREDDGFRCECPWGGSHLGRSGPTRQVMNALRLAVQTRESGPLLSTEAVPVSCRGTDVVVGRCELNWTQASQLEL